MRRRRCRSPRSTGPTASTSGRAASGATSQERLLDAIGLLGRIPTRSDPGLEQATDAARQTAQLYRQLAPFRSKDGESKGFGSPVPYPGGDDSFPRRLAGVAAMLAAGLPLRCVAITAPGAYDTHDSQPGDLAAGLKLTADSLLAFQRDLEARGLADRVLVHVWSEFGRRAEENASNGTDHGAAGAGFLIGTKASGTMVGEFPGLDKLDRDGNLRATTDFRGLYAALIEDWLGGDAAAVLPDAQAPAPEGRQVTAARLTRCRRSARRTAVARPRRRRHLPRPGSR